MPFNERQIVARIRELAANSRGSRFRGIGIGDDCALLQVPPGRELLVTTDFSLEGVHFRRDWHPPESVGHRCLARGLSDIAAMGGAPLAVFVSLAVPKQLAQKWIDGFFLGLLKLAGRFQATLAGGDTASSRGSIVADIVVVGSVPVGKAILRAGAKLGDSLHVTGELGGSAAALALLLSGQRKRLRPNAFPRHFFPEPRIEVGRVLREKHLASSMIDLSDGLSTDLAHLCEESRVGAELQRDEIPLADIGNRKVDLRFALHGGEDYELLFTARRGTRIPQRVSGVRITKIGLITSGPRVLLKGSNGSNVLEAKGWEHFRK